MTRLCYYDDDDTCGGGTTVVVCFDSDANRKYMCHQKLNESSLNNNTHPRQWTLSHTMVRRPILLITTECPCVYWELALWDVRLRIVISLQTLYYRTYSLSQQVKRRPESSDFRTKFRVASLSCVLSLLPLQFVLMPQRCGGRPLEPRDEVSSMIVILMRCQIPLR